jgi:hypothetical protein
VTSQKDTHTHTHTFISTYIYMYIYMHKQKDKHTKTSKKKKKKQTQRDLPRIVVQKVHVRSVVACRDLLQRYVNDEHTLHDQVEHGE